MAKVDLHVHSKYSHHASEWFLKKLGAYESYTTPDEVYRKAKARGMRFVTLTDHNRIQGALYLKNKYPEDTFTGMEATGYFPEDGCKIHLLVYGLTHADFERIEELRSNIYALRDYIKAQDLAYSVAHATYAVNNRLTRDHLEKLILLFDVFEGINGSRDKMSNLGWMEILKNLTPAHIDRLYRKHAIEPISDDPWLKGLTAGSDDHANLFVGSTYTQVGANTPEEYLYCLKDKLTLVNGRHNNYRTFVFTIYKIAYDFSKQKHATLSQSLLSQMNDLLFNGTSLSLKNRIKMQSYKLTAKKDDAIEQAVHELVDLVKQGQGGDIEKQFEVIFNQISKLADGFFKVLLQSLEKDLKNGDMLKLVRDISSVIPAIFLSMPFFTSLMHMFRSRPLINRLRQDFVNQSSKQRKKIIWFTDTLEDLNGVAETIKKIGWISHAKNINVCIATTLSARADRSALPPNVLELPHFYSFKLPYYENINLRIPSLLKAVETIYQAEPDEFIISTPGPVGLLGILAARLLNVRCTGIYHTDFTAQVQHLTGQEDLAKVVEGYEKWFYTLVQEVKVPTHTYLEQLEMRGYDPLKLSHYHKGVDTELFAPAEGPTALKKKLAGRPTLVYAGRISQDKNLGFLLEVYHQLLSRRPELQLLIAGDGPYAETLRKMAKAYPHVQFLGRVPRASLKEVYSAADLLVFPSTTDTFGMVVLEAQACGLPAVVSNIGGPKEIVINQKTGMVVQANYREAWVLAIQKLLDMKEQHPKHFGDMKKAARTNVLDHYQWDHALAELFGTAQQAGNLYASSTIRPLARTN